MADRAGDRLFATALRAVAGAYLVLILGMIAADVWLVADRADAATWRLLTTPEIRQSVALSLLTCTVSACSAVVVAVPAGYLLSRERLPGRRLVEAAFDIPIVLPPLVVGLSLLILMQTPPGRWLEDSLWRPAATWLLATPVGGGWRTLWDGVLGLRYRPEQWTGLTYTIPAVMLAQFTVAAAFAVRAMRLAFAQTPRRAEEIAWTLGASRWQAFRTVALPQVRRGVLAAFTLAWARSLGEFGPILIFAGATRFRTEVLSTSVYLEFSVGNLPGAVALSLLMVTVAVAVLLLAQTLGLREAAT